MMTYDDVINKVDREMLAKKQAAKSGKKSRRHKKPVLEVHQSDILLVDFGDTRRKHRGKRPVCVISSDRSIAGDSIIMVVPLYRKPCRDNKGMDVLITKDDCDRLHYDEYAGIANVCKIRRKQIVRQIGHIRNQAVIKELTDAFLQKVGDCV